MHQNLDNNRLIKNTFFLYFRMIITLLVSLYTSRLMLHILGINDLGIYNVTGGIITMLTFISSSLSTATSRFISFELGKENGNVKNVFRCSLTIYYILAIIILILGETIGLWFVYNKLVIPEERLSAALWVYQCSIITSIIAILGYPYNAMLIAYEKMKTFAYISIFESITKLICLYALIILPFDKLKAYAVLILLMQLSIRFIYVYYCSKNIKTCSSKWLWESEMSKKIFFFSGWSMTGCFAYTCYTQGLNILLNIFFGPIVNAARAIAVQVQGALYQFVNNLQLAVNPQMIKSYAMGDLETSHKLMINISKFSFILFLIVSLPIYINVEYILYLWLGEVPKYSASFIRIMLIVSLNNSLSRPIVTSVQATGKIKKFQIYESLSLLTVLPVSYIFLKLFNISAVKVLIIYMIIEIITQFIRVYIVYPIIKLEKKIYITKIIFPIAKATIPIIILAYYCSTWNVSTFMLFAVQTLIIIITSIFLFYNLSFSTTEKEYIKAKVFSCVKLYK